MWLEVGLPEELLVLSESDVSSFRSKPTLHLTPHRARPYPPTQRLIVTCCRRSPASPSLGSGPGQPSTPTPVAPPRGATRELRAPGRPASGSSSVVVHASGDGAAHSGIVEESVVHGSSLASVGISTRKKSVISESAGTDPRPLSERIGIQGVHHVAVIVDDLAASMEFYRDFLGLPVNPDRPNDKLPYDGAWLMMGPEMVHLMELPNPDPTDAEFRPAHGGKDRHFCVGVKDLAPLTEALEARGCRSPRAGAVDRLFSSGTRTATRWRWWRGSNGGTRAALSSSLDRWRNLITIILGAICTQQGLGVTKKSSSVIALLKLPVDLRCTKIFESKRGSIFMSSNSKLSGPRNQLHYIKKMDVFWLPNFVEITPRADCELCAVESGGKDGRRTRNRTVAGRGRSGHRGGTVVLRSRGGLPIFCGSPPLTLDRQNGSRGCIGARSSQRRSAVSGARDGSREGRADGRANALTATTGAGQAPDGRGQHR